MPRIVAQDSTRFWVELPLNTPRGSVRVKRRRCESDFGMIVPACSTRLERSDYLEWQIRYDLPDSPENRKRTTLGDCSFSNNVNVRKIPSELSELFFWSNRFGFLSDEEVRETFQSVADLDDSSFFDAVPLCRVSAPAETRNGVLFERKNVLHPLFIYDIGCFSLEITIQKQQRGSGVQPMLYFCIPVENLEFAYPCFERKAKTSPEKTCKWIVDSRTSRNFALAFRLLGMLSSRHRHDVLAILRTLFPALIN